MRRCIGGWRERWGAGRGSEQAGRAGAGPWAVARGEAAGSGSRAAGEVPGPITSTVGATTILAGALTSQRVLCHPLGCNVILGMTSSAQGFVTSPTALWHHEGTHSAAPVTEPRWPTLRLLRATSIIPRLRTTQAPVVLEGYIRIGLVPCQSNRVANYLRERAGAGTRSAVFLPQ